MWEKIDKVAWKEKKNIKKVRGREQFMKDFDNRDKSNVSIHFYIRLFLKL